jgi:hypothetical protein
MQKTGHSGTLYLRPLAREVNTDKEDKEAVSTILCFYISSSGSCNASAENIWNTRRAELGKYSKYDDVCAAERSVTGNKATWHFRKMPAGHFPKMPGFSQSCPALTIYAPMIYTAV